MSTIYLMMPSRVAADAAEHWVNLPCRFAVVADGRISGQGMAPLPELAELVGKAARVVMLLAASDVSLLRVKVPPLSPARLRQALPHLVEDQLMSDPFECVVVAEHGADETRTVGVIQRGWLEILSRCLGAYGARNLAALPSQLCLPLRDSGVSASVVEYENDVELTLRLSAWEGIGLPIMPDDPASAALDAMQALQALVPSGPIVLRVPPGAIERYRAMPDAEQRVTLEADQWPDWIAAAGETSLDLMTGLGGAAARQADWRQWRWPLVLAALLLVLNVTALNVDWWRQENEAARLRTTMLQGYRNAFPKEPVVLDPLAQMKQKIELARRGAGQPAPDDFIVLAGGFAEAWASVAPQGQGGVPALASMEYRDRGLLVRPKASSRAFREQVRLALASRNLVLTHPANDGVWHIRSTR